jgi:hypothetical protein
VALLLTDGGCECQAGCQVAGFPRVQVSAARKPRAPPALGSWRDPILLESLSPRASAVVVGVVSVGAGLCLGRIRRPEAASCRGDRCADGSMRADCGCTPAAWAAWLRRPSCEYIRVASAAVRLLWTLHIFLFQNTLLEQSTQSYLYEHLRAIGRLSWQILEIDEITTGTSLLIGTSITIEIIGLPLK